MTTMATDFLDEVERSLKEQHPVYLSGEGFEATFESRILSHSQSQITLQNSVPYTMISRVMAGRQCSLQLGRCRLFSDSPLSSDGLNLIMSCSRSEKYGETRGAERFPFSSKESVFCQFHNPYDPPTLLKKKVTDMSAGGLSLVSRRGTKLFSKETPLRDLEILVDGKTYKKANGRVVYQRQLLDLQGRAFDQIGIQFT